MSAPVVRRIASAEFAVVAADWPMARARRSEIDAHFARLKRDRPKLWNGKVLVARDVELVGDRLTGHAFETDFASFQWWLGTGFPDPAIRNIFGMAVVRGADGGFLLGVMGGHTANAGSVYFPSGTPDPGDISGGRLDLAGSVVRELKEETGLEAAAFVAEPGWTVVLDGPRVALMRTFLADEASGLLVARARAFIAADPGAELADVIAVHGIDDLPPVAPAFVRAFLESRLAD
ncbi:NUDIX hydrolase [Blastochloris tepida]|uniref:Nudix hydrolase domain-containing protein n=1 Tax=Blastochloris tepida TaxID=2233851 RepID=A0A348FVR4_9HYPH|nr:NUDIX hydrolase [Blastochloris tepida]BBF91397.1 hypothetical protein BLTE_00820 [Blastochloris tepida]